MGHKDNFDYSSIVRLERYSKELYELLAPKQRYSDDAVYELASKLDRLLCLVHRDLSEYPVAPYFEEARLWKVDNTGSLTQEHLFDKVLQVLGLIVLFYDGPLQFDYLGNADGD
jgi:hypothetical protein